MIGTLRRLADFTMSLAHFYCRTCACTKKRPGSNRTTTQQNTQHTARRSNTLSPILRHLLPRSQREHSESTEKAPTSRGFAYKLHIRIEPHWAAILKRIVQAASEEEYEEWISEHARNLQADRMLHSTFVFTEFFDFVSGLTIRHLDRNLDEKSFAGFVDNFCCAGRMFGGHPHILRDRDEFSLEITEHSIRNNCFDPNTGWRSWTTREEEFLLLFPLQSIFDFLLILLLRLEDVSVQRVVKWPNAIERELERRGIKYESYSGNEPTLINLEQVDSRFYKEFGGLAIAEHDIFPTPSFETEFAYLQIDLKVFRPTGNDRIANSSLDFL
jgi:hypothetical protein